MRPKGSAETLEMRRRIAARLLKVGKGIRETARLVGASPSSVWEWKRRLEEGGEAALKVRSRLKRKRRLREEEQQRLRDLLLQGPRAAGFPTDLWTLKRVALGNDKKAQVENKVIVISDKSGFRSQPVVRRTWVPKGQTPQQYSRDRHHCLSAIAALALFPEEEAVGLFFQLVAHNIKISKAKTKRPLWSSFQPR